MKKPRPDAYKPLFKPETWTARDRKYLAPFATNIDGLVHVLHNIPPEIIGALCSRASRAKDSLLRVFLNEYMYPIVDGEDKKLARELNHVVEFLSKHGFKNILNNQRAQGFYIKLLSLYGDDSIAQNTGTHLVYWGISQVAMKFIEDQRIGLEPIEKSTRYVNFGKKLNGRYLYYAPAPDLRRLGLLAEYKKTLDGLFGTYNRLVPQLITWLKLRYDEKEGILEKKAFDTLRGLLPMATVGQVAFRGNADAFGYLINRSRTHELGEFRWIAETSKRELDTEIPSLLLRTEEEKSKRYQEYLANCLHDTEHALPKQLKTELGRFESVSKPEVRLVSYDKHAVEHVITGILFSLPRTRSGWNAIASLVQKMSRAEKKEILDAYFHNRNERWYKPGRALENADFHFEILMDIGAYRDLHRHRMLTQDRQAFSIHHGFSTPHEVAEAGMDQPYQHALTSVIPLFNKLERENPLLAQYVVPLAYRIRFYQKQNASSLFWETELRTGSQGHPDYRHIEQEKYRLFARKAPLLASYARVDMNEYPLARRGETDRIAAKEQFLQKKLSQKK
jgi:thymidylate synthase ThyX